MQGVTLIVVHLIADFPLQPDRMATQKFESRYVRGIHCSIHVLLLFAVSSIFFGIDIGAAFSFTVGILHFAIDSRRWVEVDADGWQGKPIAMDQVLHVASIVAVYWLFVSIGAIDV